MPSIDLSPILRLCQNSLEGILEHYSKIQLTEAVFDSTITIKEVKDGLETLYEWLEHARKCPPPRECDEDRAELRHVRSHIGHALLELASYLEHLEKLAEICMSKSPPRI